jgi:hypothetical protein
MTLIRVSDYARSPGGRYVSDGPYSGEWFRDEILRPALDDAIRNHALLEVELDGTSGYGSSFLEEAFGGLIRKRIFDPEAIRRFLVVVARRPVYAPYQALAERYMRDARPQSVAA